jgi:hypothetical protein
MCRKWFLLETLPPPTDDGTDAFSFRVAGRLEDYLFVSIAFSISHTFTNPMLPYCNPLKGFSDFFCPSTLPARMRQSSSAQTCFAPGSQSGRFRNDEAGKSRDQFWDDAFLTLTS